MLMYPNGTGYTVPSPAVSKDFVLPGHVTASTAALVKVKALSELSKTTPLQIVSLHDSNGTPGTFTPDLWERGNFARLLDAQLSWMRGNTTSGSADNLGPQTQVIKFSTMGNATANSPEDTPWHPKARKMIFEPRTVLGPFGQSYKSLGGVTCFSDPANTNRQIGFIVDRTSTGQDWEKNMDRVAVGYSGRGNADQNPGVATGTAVKADGTTYGGASYNAPCSTFTLSIHDVSAIDFTTIPSTGWDEANAACIAIKAACDAVGATTSITIDPQFGVGASLPGYLSSWCAGMTTNKKWLVKLKVPDGAFMGAALEYLVLNNSTITGGACVWDMAYSGNALCHCEWKRYNNDGTPLAGWSGEPGDFNTDTYIRSELCARLLMRGENSYGVITNYSNKTSWALATHNAPGLHVGVCSLLVNDLNNAVAALPNAPLGPVFYNHAYNMVQQFIRVNPEGVFIFNLPPCPGALGADNTYRDDWFNGNHSARILYTEVRAQIKAACAQFPANTVVFDYQEFHNNVAPTVLKGRIGQFGGYKRETADPIDPSHFKTPTWTSHAVSDISKLFQAWCYR